MAERLNRFIDRNPAEEALVTAAWSPTVDIQETDKEYLIWLGLTVAAIFLVEAEPRASCGWPSRGRYSASPPGGG